MEINNIIQQGQRTEEEMIWLVERYILDRKGARVNINLKKGLAGLPRMIAKPFYERIIIAGALLAAAYDREEYISENGIPK